MSIEFWVQMVVYALSIGIFAGTVLTKIGHLEKKMDTIGCFGERITAAEQSVKSAHHRIDGLECAPVKRKKAR